MKATLLRNILIAGLASAAFSSCAPVKFLSMSDRFTAIGAVAEFENIESKCEDGQEEGAILADEAGNAYLVRSECENFEEPELLNPEEIEVSPDGEEIKLGEDIFELKREGSDSGENSEMGENSEERSREESREERVAEEPKLNTEVPKTNTEVPRLNTEVPKTNTEVPRLNTEVPKANTEVPKNSSEEPRNSEEGRI